MKIQKLFSTILILTVLAIAAAGASGQTIEQVAREHAENAVRSELHSKLNFKSGQFLNVHREEKLEEDLAMVTIGWRLGPVFIYKITPTGFEIKENSIVNHIATDADFIYIVAVSSKDENVYRIHGFGVSESLTDFERLMATLKLKVASSDQAESLADFYRKVNPENQEGLTPISGLLEFKQAAEKQCQSGAKSFDIGEKAFAIWWNHARPLYTSLPFQQSAPPHGSGYLVEWIILSSPSKENCGGAPLRAQLEVGSDGHVGKLTFSPI